jgi:hypothetical protein
MSSNISYPPIQYSANIKFILIQKTKLKKIMCPVLKYMIFRVLTYQSALGHIETKFFKKKFILKSDYFYIIE